MGRRHDIKKNEDEFQAYSTSCKWYVLMKNGRLLLQQAYAGHMASSKYLIKY